MVYWLTDKIQHSKAKPEQKLNKNAMHTGYDGSVPKPCVKYEHAAPQNGPSVHAAILHMAELLHHGAIRHESMVPIRDNPQRMAKREREHEAIPHNAHLHGEQLDGRGTLQSDAERLQSHVVRHMRTVLEQ
jgi:hypothetical protein